MVDEILAIESEAHAYVLKHIKNEEASINTLPLIRRRNFFMERDFASKPLAAWLSNVCLETYW